MFFRLAILTWGSNEHDFWTLMCVASVIDVLQRLRDSFLGIIPFPLLRAVPGRLICPVNLILTTICHTNHSSAQ